MSSNLKQIASLVITLFLLSGCDQISVLANLVSNTPNEINKLTNTTTTTIRDARHIAETVCINKIAALHPNRTDFRIKNKKAIDYERFDIVVEAYYSEEEQKSAEKNPPLQNISSSVPVTATRFRDDYYCVTDRAVINLEKFPEMSPK